MSSTPQVTPDVLAQRAAALQATLANAALERGAPSPDALAILEAWARGELTDAQRAEQIAMIPV